MTVSVGVVTDSTADLDAGLAARFGIDVVPLFVNFGDARYRDGVDLTRDEFFDRMRAGGTLPTTSQPTAATFEDAFRPHVEAGRAVVGIFISSKLSGTINAARAAAEQFPGADIRLIDSQTVTGGCALLALRAGGLAQLGASADEIVAAVETDRARQHGYCTVPDLSHAERSGRIGKAQAILGGLLKIVPLLTFASGEVDVAAKVRTFTRAQDAMIDATIKEIGDVEKSRIMVLHSHAPESGRAVFDRLREKLGSAPAFMELAEAGPAISTHAGEGAVGIFSVAG
ncbi:MAG: DegV family protein [Candidatus Eremiobacteraeota bacterium]|nr:DegV family protein [Candidatus Eremiobacteraeota bacterium]